MGNINAATIQDQLRSSAGATVAAMDDGSILLRANPSEEINLQGNVVLSSGSGLVAADRGSQVYNVLAFGARGDGVTDDQPAIQEAIDAAADARAGVVFVPSLIFATGAPLQKRNNVTVRGVSRGLAASTLTPGSVTSVIKALGSFNVFEAQDDVQGFGLQYLDVRGGTIGLKCFGENPFGFIEHCFFGQQTSHGVQTDAIEQWIVRNVRIRNVGGTAWYGGKAGQEFASGGAITSGGVVVTINPLVYVLSAIDVGKILRIVGARTNGSDLTGGISSINTTTNAATISPNGAETAQVTLTNAAFTLGSDGRTERTVFQDCRFEATGEHGLVLRPHSKWAQANTVLIQNMTLIQVGMHGIWCPSATNLTLDIINTENCSYLFDNTYDAVHIERDTTIIGQGGPTIVNIRGGHLGYSTTGTGNAQRYGLFVNADTCSAENMRADGKSGVGFYFKGRTSYRLLKGTIVHVDNPGTTISAMQTPRMAGPSATPALTIARFVPPGSSTYTLTLGALGTTAAIAFDADAATVQAAIRLVHATVNWSIVDGTTAAFTILVPPNLAISASAGTVDLQTRTRTIVPSAPGQELALILVDDAASGVGTFSDLGVYLADANRTQVLRFNGPSKAWSAPASVKWGFFGVAPVARPDVTGSKGANAALTSLLTQLALLGLITDSSS